MQTCFYLLGYDVIALVRPRHAFLKSASQSSRLAARPLRDFRLICLCVPNICVHISITHLFRTESQTCVRVAFPALMEFVTQ